MPASPCAGPLLYLKIDELRHQLEVNVIGQLIVTQAFAPLLGADTTRKGAAGRIVMISSVGGKNANAVHGRRTTRRNSRSKACRRRCAAS